MVDVALESNPDLAELVARVERGEEVRLTRGGVIIARLAGQPEGELAPLSPAEAVRRLKAGRRGLRMGGESVDELKNAGRP